jgi:hypothetical protein
VTSVERTHDAGWFKPAGLTITTETGQFDLNIVWKKSAMSRDKRNNAARDKAIETIRAAVTAAKTAAPAELRSRCVVVFTRCGCRSGARLVPSAS